MHTSIDLQTAAPDRALQWDTLAPGLTDPVHDSQAVFRVLLDALSRPAQVRQIAPGLGGGIAGVPPAALAVLYALCDYATPVWLGQAHDALVDALRFHTGAPLAATQNQAAFAWIAEPAAMPALADFAQGSPESPEYGATVLIGVDSFEQGPTLVCRGPGIEHQARFAPTGLPPGFWQERAVLAAGFPCGIDLIFISGNRLVGVPRTTLIEEA